MPGGLDCKCKRWLFALQNMAFYMAIDRLLPCFYPCFVFYLAAVLPCGDCKMCHNEALSRFPWVVFLRYGWLVRKFVLS